MTDVPLYAKIFVWLVIIAFILIFVVIPAYGNLSKVDKMRKKMWDKKFRKLHPELFDE